MPIKPKSKPRNRRGGDGGSKKIRPSEKPEPNGGSQYDSPLPVEPKLFLPEVMNLKTKEIHLELSEAKMFQMTELDNPIVLYGQPYCGKTYILKKTSEEISKWYSIIRDNQWIKFISLKDAAEVLKSEDRPQTFIELCATCLKIPLRSLKRIFKPIPLDEVKEFRKQQLQYNLIKGELFLDGLDEMPPRERGIMMEFLPQLVSKREECPIRIWLSARSYLKPLLVPIFGMGSSFEIVGYDSVAQMKVIMARIQHEKQTLNKWASTEDFDCQRQHLMDITRRVFRDFEGEIEGFWETIGSMLSILSEIAGNLVQFITVPSTEENLKMDLYCTPTSAKEVLDLVAHGLKIRYEIKFGSPFPIHRMNDLVDFAIRSVYKFDEESVPIDDELMNTGFLVGGEEDGLIKFLNRSLANYWIAKYYAQPVYSGSHLSDQFFLTVLLFEEDAKECRKFYDLLLAEYRSRCMSDLLFEFLVGKYRLASGMEEEWEKIRHDGTVLHLALMEGFHNIAVSILDAFCRETQRDELMKFLLITAPVNVEQKTLEHTTTCMRTHKIKKARHRISTLSMIALFGSDHVLTDYFEAYMNVIGIEEMQREFNNEDHWTPLHYAAAHSNLWFIDSMLRYIKPYPAVFNPDGKLALHLLMDYSWSYSMTLKDHATPDLSIIKVKEGWGSVDEESEEVPKVRKTRASAVRSMEKALDGKENLQRLVNHQCFLYMLKIDDINAGDKDNMTVLHYAAKYGPLETVEFLLSNGGNLESVTFDGKTPFHIAEMCKKTDISRYLIDKRLEATGFYDVGPGFLLSPSPSHDESDEEFSKEPEPKNFKAGEVGEDSDESPDETENHCAGDVGSSTRVENEEEKVQDCGSPPLLPVAEEEDNEEPEAEANNDEDFRRQHFPWITDPTVEYEDVSPYSSYSEESTL